MPSYSLVITSRALPTDRAALIPNAGNILGAFAEIARKEVTSRVWMYSRFEYKWIRPKPSFSKSERAWIGTGSADDLSITLTNNATNRRGDHYAGYVHLAGRPKSEKLVFEVQAHLRDNVAPRALRAIVHDMIKASEKVTIKTVRVT